MIDKSPILCVWILITDHCYPLFSFILWINVFHKKQNFCLTINGNDDVNYAHSIKMFLISFSSNEKVDRSESIDASKNRFILSVCKNNVFGVLFVYFKLILIYLNLKNDINYLYVQRPIYVYPKNQFFFSGIYG